MKLEEYNINYKLFTRVMLGVSISAFFVHIAFMVVFQNLGYREMVYINVGSLVMFCISGALTMTKHPIFAFFVTIAEVATHGIAATVFLGWHVGFHVYILLLIPVLLFSPLHFWAAKLPILMQIAIVYLMLAYQGTINSNSVYQVPLATTQVLNIVNLGTFLVFMSFLCGIYNLIVLQSNSKLLKLANTDPLTGLLNRRSFLETVEQEINKQINEHLIPKMCVAVCDIDFFKRVNDTYNHDGGDAVLKAVSAMLKSMAMKPQFCARWGGEEFVIIFPGKTTSETFDAMEEIRKKIKSAIIQHNSHCISVTITSGISNLQPNEKIEHVIDRADKGLYVGKQGGRNKTVISEAFDTVLYAI